MTVGCYLPVVVYQYGANILALILYLGVLMRIAFSWF